MKHLHIIILFLLLTSCRTQTVVLPESHSRDSLVTRVNTRVDSIREKDSISFSFTEIPVIFMTGGDRVPKKTVNEQGAKVEGFGEARFRGTAISDSVARVPTIHHWHTRTHDRMITHTDTITIIKTDTVSVAIPCPSWGKGADRRERGFSLSERVRVLRKGCLIGGIGAVVLLLLIRIAARLYLRR